MHKWKISLLTVLVIVTLVTALQAVSASEPKGFQINVQRDGDTLLLSCAKGCNWEKLTASCPSPNCLLDLDEAGVRVKRKP